MEEVRHTWSESKLSVPVLPAIPLQVALYSTELVQRAVNDGLSVSVIESDVYMVYSIRWGHRLVGTDSPTDHPLVWSVGQGARGKLSLKIRAAEATLVSGCCC